MGIPLELSLEFNTSVVATSSPAATGSVVTAFWLLGKGPPTGWMESEGGNDGVESMALTMLTISWVVTILFH